MALTAWAQEQAAKHEAWGEIREKDARIKQLEAENKALANAVLNALYGTLLDEHGNRDENGLLAWGKAEDARNALIEVATLARKVGA